MELLIVGLIGWLVPALIAILIIYGAVRLAIRHERDNDGSRQLPG